MFRALHAAALLAAASAEQLPREYQGLLDSDDVCSEGVCALGLLQVQRTPLPGAVLMAPPAAPALTNIYAAPEAIPKTSLVAQPAKSVPASESHAEPEASDRYMAMWSAFVAGNEPPAEFKAPLGPLSLASVQSVQPVMAPPAAAMTPSAQALPPVVAVQTSGVQSVQPVMAPPSAAMWSAIVAGNEPPPADFAMQGATPPAPVAAVPGVLPVAAVSQMVAAVPEGPLALATAKTSSSPLSDAVPRSAPAPGYEHPAWLQSCTKIMLDIGSGRGDHVRMLYEPETFNKTSLVLVIQQIFGNPEKRKLPGNESGICVLGLEPNPAMQKPLEELKQTYAARGWNTHFYPFAAWTSDEIKTSPDGKVSVHTIDIAKFVSSIPHAIGVSMMLMDIDGGEYETLAKLLEETMMCESVIRSSLISAHQTGDVTRWADPALSKITGRSFDDIKKRVTLQHCQGKSTPVMDLNTYNIEVHR